MFVSVLIAVEVPVVVTLSDAVPLSKRLIVSFHRICLNQRGSMGLDTKLSLLAGIAGNDDIYGKLHHRADHRIGDSCIAGTGIQYDLPFPYSSANQCLQEHPPNRPVFQTATGIRELGLGI